MVFMTFPSYWECHHPNWRTPSFFRGVETTNQMVQYSAVMYSTSILGSWNSHWMIWIWGKRNHCDWCYGGDAQFTSMISRLMKHGDSPELCSFLGEPWTGQIWYTLIFGHKWGTYTCKLPAQEIQDWAWCSRPSFLALLKNMISTGEVSRKQ